MVSFGSIFLNNLNYSKEPKNESYKKTEDA